MTLLKKIFAVALVMLWTTVVHECNEGPITIIRNLIQNNLVGAPVTHKKTEWDFDPDVALKRRELYQEANGFRGERLIERVGLGLDGHHNERQTNQRSRDAGLLGGTIYQFQYGLNTVDPNYQ